VLEPSRGAVERVVVRQGLGLAGGVARLLAPSRSYQRAVSALQQWAQDPGLMAGADPEFSRRYRLLGSDQRAIEAVFGPRVLGFFARQSGHAIAIQSASGWLVIFRHDVLVKPWALRTFLQEAASVARLLIDDQHRG
jgi:hypothetical protein